jgi:hypothetical protein
MKKVGVVLTTTVALAGALLATSALAARMSTPARAAARRSVTVQIKTMHRTLLRPTAVHRHKGWITKGRTPRGKCPASSAAGALGAATHGRWTGKYYASVSGIFITSILGVRPTGSDFWEVFVNGHPSSRGICDIKLRAGERLLFKIAK